MGKLIDLLKKRRQKKPAPLPENPYRPIYRKPRSFDQLLPTPKKPEKK